MAWELGTQDPESGAYLWRNSVTGEQQWGGVEPPASTGPEFSSPWSGQRTGWNAANIDQIFEKFARSEAGAVGPETLAYLRQAGVSPEASLDALWNAASTSANPNWAGGSPTGIKRGILQHAGVLDRFDNPTWQQQQGREDQSIWQGQQQGGDDFMDFLAPALILGLGGAGAMGLLGAGAGASSLGGSLVADAFASGFALPEGVAGLSAFDAATASDMAMGEAMRSAVPGLTPAAEGASASLFSDTTDPIRSLIEAQNSGMTGDQAIEAMRGAGVEGVRSAGEQWLYDTGSSLRSTLTDPTTRAGMQAAQLGSKLIGSDGGDAQAKQQGSQAGFYASLASLISSALQSRGSSSGSGTPALDSTYNASQAVAPDQRSSFLYGSSGGPSTQAYTMEKGAPTAIPALGGSATGGTPTAPTMPSQGQGAVRMRRKMYA